MLAHGQQPQRVLCITRPFETSKAPRGESEELLGRWRRCRGIGDEIVIATKVGVRPLAPAADFVRSDGSLIEMDGLTAKAIRESAERSMARLGTGRLDLMYAHIPDPFVSLPETVEGSPSWFLMVWSGCSG